MFRTNTAKTALAAVAGVMAIGAATTAAAQPYGYDGGYYAGGSSYYDPCRRDSANRTTTGALIGGALGAVIGSNAAARNARTEGALVGGALGAVIGGSAGRNSAACAPGYGGPQSSYYNDGRYGAGSSYGYGGSAYGYNPGSYYGDSYAQGGGYYGSRYDDGRYAYDRRGSRYAIAQGRQVDASGCTLAESPIHMPDGRTQVRFVRVCQDASGRYQVVD